jgi:hypothetical protein
MLGRKTKIISHSAYFGAVSWENCSPYPIEKSL